MAPVTYAVCVCVPPEGVAALAEYEAVVLPLLGEHGGRLARRARCADGTLEIFLVEFDSAQGARDLRGDPRRTAVAHVLEASGAEVDVTERLAVLEQSEG